jgi:adenylyltransferase/sulfurtransferase
MKHYEELEKLRERIEILEKENAKLKRSSTIEEDNNIKGNQGKKEILTQKQKLSSDQIERYSRQLLISGGFGVEGQLKLLKAKVLVVGAGGIGSSLILYLAAGGVGQLTLVDFDEVDISNLHRQVIHKACDVGMNKSESARNAVMALNPSICCEIVKIPLTYSNALELVQRHDVVVDASDNPQTRYVINDACVIGAIPLVSGSAMGTEGQLTVYNYKGGPCYRCLYPKVNATEGCKSCADNGVLGPVPGVIGVLQAMEIIKIITGFG